MQTLLDNPVGTTTVREVLLDVVLDPTDPNKLDDDLFAPDKLLDRLKLARKLGRPDPRLRSMAVSRRIGRKRQDVELTLGVTGRVALNDGDVVVSIEADSRWITDQPAAGSRSASSTPARSRSCPPSRSTGSVYVSQRRAAHSSTLA